MQSGFAVECQQLCGRNVSSCPRFGQALPHWPSDKQGASPSEPILFGMTNAASDSAGSRSCHWPSAGESPAAPPCYAPHETADGLGSESAGVVFSLPTTPSADSSGTARRHPASSAIISCLRRRHFYMSSE
eukprot:scaffold1330_cov240-Pinguiococcus_pyrenoidosus.AAC.28